MIRLTSIRISEFRGIKHLDLRFGGENFAISGPNGTGKSGVVDAIEFALTGTISRLSGTGTGTVSVREHGPHVDSRDAPATAFVQVEISIPGLGKTATIYRSIDKPKAPTITPNDADIVEILKRFADHREFVLSRREIIRYVLAEPGVRSREVQALLQLDQLDKIRSSLTKIANAERRKAEALERPLAQAGSSLATALGIARPTASAVLEAANARRATLGLQSLSELRPSSSIRDGLEAGLGAAPSKIAKSVALADLTRAQVALATYQELLRPETLLPPPRTCTDFGRRPSKAR